MSFRHNAYSWRPTRCHCKNLFPSSVTLPSPVSPTTMPDPYSATSQQTAQSAAASAMAAAGRTSTILTSPSSRSSATASGKLLGA